MVLRWGGTSFQSTLPLPDGDYMGSRSKSGRITLLCDRCKRRIRHPACRQYAGLCSGRMAHDANKLRFQRHRDSLVNSVGRGYRARQFSIGDRTEEVAASAKVLQPNRRVQRTGRACEFLYRNRRPLSLMHNVVRFTEHRGSRITTDIKGSSVMLTRWASNEDAWRMASGR